MDERRNSQDTGNNIDNNTTEQSRFLRKQNFAKRITLVVISVLLLGLLVFAYTHYYLIAVGMTIFIVLVVSCITICYHVPNLKRSRTTSTRSRQSSLRGSRSRIRHRRRGSVASNRSVRSLSRTPSRSPSRSPLHSSRHLPVTQSHSLLLAPTMGHISCRDSPRRHSTGRRSPSYRDQNGLSPHTRYSRSTECVGRDSPPEYHLVVASSAQIKTSASCAQVESPPSYQTVIQNSELFPQSNV